MSVICIFISHFLTRMTNEAKQFHCRHHRSHQEIILILLLISIHRDMPDAIKYNEKSSNSLNDLQLDDKLDFASEP